MTLTAKQFLTRNASVRRMTSSPSVFDGSLDELCERFVAANLPSASIVKRWHRLLINYAASKDALFLIRYMMGTDRRQTYHTDHGGRFKATDNAPAWWFHFALFHELEPTADEFREIIATIPTHLFDVKSQLPVNINANGWHVAHIFDVKTGDTNYRRWTHADLVGRFLRNVHPCNYFFVPKQDWQKWGGNERVVAYFVELYESKYSEVWTEFVRLSHADMSRISRVSGSIRYHYGEAVGPTQRDQIDVSERNRTLSHGNPATSYKASRLTFKADVIDPLAMEDTFRVETPQGVFEMTKADFLRVFPKVSATLSYREGRVYNYSKTPRAALQFLVSGDELAGT